MSKRYDFDIATAASLNKMANPYKKIPVASLDEIINKAADLYEVSSPTVGCNSNFVQNLYDVAFLRYLVHRFFRL